MPPHEVYIETHLGGGAIIRYKKLAKRNIGIEIDPKTIEMWTKTFSEIDFELIHGDAIRYLESYNFTGKELVYCDPPYLRKTRKKRYPTFRYEYTLEQHKKLLEVIKSLPCMVMISGYESSLYKKSLKGWNIYSFDAACHHGTATEWIWMNHAYPVSAESLDPAGRSGEYAAGIKRVAQSEQGVATNLATLLAFETL